MEVFGPFQAGREIDTAGGSTVFKAQKEGDARGQYVIKLFLPERLVEEESKEIQSELDPLFKDIGGAFTSRVNLQKKAAESSPYFAPILAAGHDGRGAWYATNFYARSAKGMLDRLVALEARDLFHIVEALVAAALHLKKHCGRPHGNLKPANVFLDGNGKPRASRIIVSDPLPGEAHDAAAYELADLRSIGELMYQLVMRRKVDFASGWVILPVESSREWTELFGKQSDVWLGLCNRLLDPHLSLERFNLEQFAALLPKLKPRASMLLTVVPATVVVLIVAAIGTSILLHRAHFGTLILTSDPPGADVVVVPIVDGFEDKPNSQTNTIAANGTPLTLSLSRGEYLVRASYGDLDGRRLRTKVEARQTITNHIGFLYGQLVVLSEPSGARFTVGGKEYTTPYTNPIARPEPVSFQLDYESNGEKYVSAQVEGTVRTNQVTVLPGKLLPPKPGEEVVEFTSDPPGAEIYIDRKLALKTAAGSPGRFKLQDGRYRVSVRLKGWPAQEQELVVNTRRGRTPVQSFNFPHGTIDVAAGEPAGMQVFVNGEPAGTSPTKLYLPPGRFDLSFRAGGYETNTTAITVADKGSYPLNLTLKALEGFIEISADPPGTEIRTLNNKVLGTAGADGMARIPLPPGTYDLKATYGDLKPVERRGIEVKAGQPRQVDPFVLEYGTVTFADIQPPDAAAAATIQNADRQVIKPGEPILLRPDAVVAYQIAAPGYQVLTTNVTIATKQNRRIAVRLSRLTVPIKLASEPPGAEFTYNGVPLNPAGGPDYALPWGPAQFVARFRRLGAATNNLELKLGQTNTVPKFSFTYGTIVLTNLPDTIVVKVDGEELPTLPGPPRVAYDRPGAYTYALFEAEQQVDSVATNLAAGGRIILNSEIASREFRNSIGLVLVKVPDLLATGKDGWVGKFEVTQAEYERVMGAAANVSKVKGPDLPVQNVNWIQANDFCQKLTEMDTRHPAGPPGHYTLPTIKQWRVFEDGADLNSAVYGKSQPAPVGSKGPANKYGVADVLGNVWEWLSSLDPKNKEYVGGSYRSQRSFGGMQAFLKTTQLQLDAGYEDLGFRVIWVPNQ